LLTISSGDVAQALKLAHRTRTKSTELLTSLKKIIPLGDFMDDLKDQRITLSRMMKISCCDYPEKPKEASVQKSLEEIFKNLEKRWNGFPQNSTHRKRDLERQPETRKVEIPEVISVK
jgi:hypothetical protein